MSASRFTRRGMLRSLPALPLASGAAAQTNAAGERPNILLVISDQFRWDCVGAMGINPMNLTPNLDAMASRGVLFRNAFCNQPVCAPTRSSMFTGQYPSKTGVWHNGVGLAENSVTLASTLRQHGYSANYIGKWHLAPNDRQRPETHGAVAPRHRGGFLDLWEASNELELTSHAYEGDMYDAAGQPMHFSGQYRTDFLTSRAQRFLRSAKSPFLLVVSYLEVHHQNDKDTFDPPKEFVGKYANPFIPQDLRPLPGSWPSQLADYYGCVAKMDDTVGTLRQTLAETGLDKNTIVAFFSDHACHFKTRNTEYKRSPHESSIHVPLIIEGPGFNRAMDVPQLVSHVDLMPTFLAAAGVAAPESVQGRSFLPLLDRQTSAWRNEVYFEMSEFFTGRGLRTPQYTYAVTAPKTPDWRQANGAARYVEAFLYDNYADPYQHVNLSGRPQYRDLTTDLRKRLIARIHEANGAECAIEPAWFPYP
ncbi:MAG TPA: sulfatase-like hydrolase/transferase [Bryobacteraceae bacterium]|nr:sulfatase-like hydrolase/transferase [Bryobacteraceae bacterium]